MPLPGASENQTVNDSCTAYPRIVECLPAADLDELAPEIFHEDEVELELKDDKGQYNYSASISLGDDKAFSFTKGKTIVGYYDRPVIDAKNDKTKQHFLQFANIDWSASSGWVQIYSQIDTSGSVLVSYTPEKDFACATVQIGIQDFPETSAKKLKITNLSLRLLPSF